MRTQAVARSVALHSISSVRLLPIRLVHFDRSICVRCMYAMQKAPQSSEAAKKQKHEASVVVNVPQASINGWVRESEFWMCCTILCRTQMEELAKHRKTVKMNARRARERERAERCWPFYYVVLASGIQEKQLHRHECVARALGCDANESGERQSRALFAASNR